MMTQTTTSPNGHKRAVLYARVSGDDSKKDGRNLKSQLDMGQEYCTDPKRDYRIVDKLPEDDKGASGASFELPQLGKILAMAERKEFDVLVVRELDRLSRNLAKQLIVEESLKRNGVTVEYVLADYADSPEGNLQKHIKATIAEYEREKIKERMMRGKQNIVKGGKVMTFGNPPFGYRISEDGMSLTIYEPEGKIVQMIFVLYAEGAGYSIIAQRLTDMGIPTWTDLRPRFTHKKRAHAAWGAASVGHILQNQTYMGKWHYGKWSGEKLIEVIVPAIVSEEQWQQAQQLRHEHINTSKRGTQHEYLMQYRLTCTCGYAIRVREMRRNDKRYHYYFCPSCNGGLYLVNTNCDLANFRADFLDKLIWDWLSDWFKDHADLRRKLEAYQANQDKINAPILALLQTNQDLMAKNQEHLATVKRMCEAKIYTIEESVERKTRLDETRISLEKARSELQEQLVSNLSSEAIESLIEFAYLMADGVAEASESFEKRRRIIDLLNVRGVLKMEDGERVCYASFILTEGGTKRLVVPTGKVLSVADISFCPPVSSRQNSLTISARLVLPNTRKRKPQADIGALFAQVPQPVTAEV